ncbi:hypothetical protein C9374_013820 [Naegleria lovaniensis]|uniref:Tyr recombinase domain-containing protein n=1 Tax=Naegleria lovaniensis TaxID=51637 RepID=A0AA88GBI3_NAELO|nr:uncharacterized protein C9374_013820 [Naegleria lovaniensis]KAG2370816.1 hypothetical protein C9374_013820 [Naegleria lovaniensis]
MEKYQPSSEKDKFEKLLIATTMIIGFRTLFRPSDIASIKWCDITWDKPKKGWIQIINSGHKTDKMNLDKDPIIIEPAPNQKYCPVKLITSYRDQVHHFKERNSPFLSFTDNRFLTSNHKCEFMKKVRKILNNKENILGHSLRIGAASKLTEEGESLDVIMHAGKWKSNACNAYTRNIALANRGLSNTLFNKEDNL